MRTLITVYIALINLVTFGLFWLDKRRSETDRWRIPERRLLNLAFMGGSLGAFIAGQVFRHKTKKQPFRRYLIIIGLFHIVFAMVLLVPDLRNFVCQKLMTIVKTLS